MNYEFISSYISDLDFFIQQYFDCSEKNQKLLSELNDRELEALLLRNVTQKEGPCDISL